MELKLIDLRRYAIDNRAEIKFGDTESGHECLINIRGQVKIPAEDRDFRVEDILEAARSFEVIGQGKSQQFARDEMASAISEAFKRRGIAASSKED